MQMSFIMEAADIEKMVRQHLAIPDDHEINLSGASFMQVVAYVPMPSAPEASPNALPSLAN